MSSSVDTLAMKKVNVHLALIQKWCTPSQIMKYLLKAPRATAHTLIVYNNLCSFLPDGNHLLEDGTHFLKETPLAYTALYLLRGLPLNALPEGMVNLEPEASLREKMMWMIRHVKSNELESLILTITGGLDEATISIPILTTFLKANNIPSQAWLNVVAENNELLSVLFENDLVSVMNLIYNHNPTNPLLKTCFEKIINRCEEMSRINDAYWKIIRPMYKMVVLKLLNVFLPCIDEAISLCALFDPLPELDVLQSTTPLTKAILDLPTVEEQAYLLGIPIHIVNPTPLLILNKIKSIHLDGEENYLRQIEEYNRQWIASLNTTLEEVDDADIVSGDSIFSYSPFDILPYINGDKMYLYIRDEAESLREKHKDRYNCAIGSVFLQEVINRQIVSQEFSFGRAMPLVSQFERLKTHSKKEEAIMVNYKNDDPTFTFSVHDSPVQFQSALETLFSRFLSGGQQNGGQQNGGQQS
jgi:hypothetical protein